MAFIRRLALAGPQKLGRDLEGVGEAYSLLSGVRALANCGQPQRLVQMLYLPTFTRVGLIVKLDRWVRFCTRKVQFGSTCHV